MRILILHNLEKHNLKKEEIGKIEIYDDGKFVLEIIDDERRDELQNFLEESFSKGFDFIGDIILTNPIKFKEDEEGFMNTLILRLSQMGFIVEVENE